MPTPIKHTLGMLSDNLRKRKSVLPLSRRRLLSWTKGLDLPRGGATVLYTGQMYQMVPAINAMTERLSKMEGSWMSSYFGLARSMNRLFNLAGLMARGDPREAREYSGYLRNIVALLRAAHVEFGYLYEDDLYAGALAHDEGLDDALKAHAQRVQTLLREHGVREVITIDPHTTDMLRTVYPKILEGFDLKVRTYLEVLEEARPEPVKRLSESVTIHDSCIYARREGVIEQPRDLLRRGGVTIHEVERSAKATQCCGGPIEMLFPGKSREVAAQRVDQLAKASQRVVTLCPLCLANLRRAAPAEIEIADVSAYLARAYCPATTRATGSTIETGARGELMTPVPT
ncbi:MAG: (Fe-S)-binding protein [Euryarchaeota archaeon]|nr:(Fe-S)-binding protein [Euryarchaeota archaeon]MDE1837547.1 (Fe-S)-binding protein [Euryarchaeota archaeon]MDE1880028.1 (Fe-S)-binding protein [Euryarchaeota archaeon]MDE2046143.1 (Fe-S)-binding protein [Thermoplasmata archaeon]